MTLPILSLYRSSSSCTFWFVCRPQSICLLCFLLLQVAVSAVICSNAFLLLDEQLSVRLLFSICRSAALLLASATVSRCMLFMHYEGRTKLRSITAATVCCRSHTSSSSNPFAGVRLSTSITHWLHLPLFSRPLFVCVSICMSVSVCLSVCVSVCLSVFTLYVDCERASVRHWNLFQLKFVLFILTSIFWTFVW